MRQKSFPFPHKDNNQIKQLLLSPLSHDTRVLSKWLLNQAKQSSEQTPPRFSIFKAFSESARRIRAGFRGFEIIQYHPGKIYKGSCWCWSGFCLHTLTLQRRVPRTYRPGTLRGGSWSRVWIKFLCYKKNGSDILSFWTPNTIYRLLVFHLPFLTFSK